MSRLAGVACARCNIALQSFGVASVSSTQCALSGLEQMRDIAVIRNSTGKLFIYDTYDTDNVDQARGRFSGSADVTTIATGSIEGLRDGLDGLLRRRAVFDRVLRAVVSTSAKAESSDRVQTKPKPSRPQRQT